MKLLHPVHVAILMVAVVLLPNAVQASTGFSPAALAIHPSLVPTEPPSRAAFGNQLGDFGESLVSGLFRERGFEVESGQVGRHGIDVIAYKRGVGGRLADVRIVEVKTRQRSLRPSLGETKMHGTQLSPQWIRRKLDELKQFDGATVGQRSLASEILETLGSRPSIVKPELHAVQVGSDRYQVFQPDAATRVPGRPVADGSFETALRRLAEPGRSQAETRAFSLRHLSSLDQVRAGGRALSGTALTVQSLRGLENGSRMEQSLRSSATDTTAVAAKRSTRSAMKSLGRAAGPVGLGVGLAIDSHDLYVIASGAYHGDLSERDALSSGSRLAGGLVGGLAGSAAGAKGGAMLGGAIGSFFPGLGTAIGAGIGGIVGGMAGGIVGYYGGSSLVGWAASSWYSAIDAEIRDEFEGRFIAGVGLSG